MEKIVIQGPAGRIQAALHIVDASVSDFLIICHPHPQFGGSMDNKVVTTLGKSYLDAGINVIRFNYRGVGESEGHYGDISGEVEDGLAVFKWLTDNHSVERLFLAGFSFGSYIAAKLAKDLTDTGITIPHLLMVAPSVENSPFSQATPLAVPCTVIMGRKDEIVPYNSVENWVHEQSPLVQFIELPEATHFFHGQLIVLKKHLSSLLNGLV